VTDDAVPVTGNLPGSNTVNEELAAREVRLRALMLRARAGDEAAYRKLLSDLSAQLRAFYRRRLVNMADEVEDLVQEALLAIHNQRHTYDVQRPLTAWCFAIAKYKLIDLLRRRSRHEEQTIPLDDGNDVIGADDLEAGDAQRDLLRLLEQLPDRQRRPIVLVKIEGQSVVDAARLTGMSEAAVKVGVHRGLKALAALIGGGP
jgi:RNA polymerase sigma-70 factor (ECF subfamily)